MATTQQIRDNSSHGPVGCVFCYSEDREFRPATRTVEGDPCCEFHYLREIRDSQVIVDDGEPQEMSSPPRPAELCKRCGEPKHRGRCRKAALSKAALIPG